MEEKYTTPVLGESYYKELEEQRKKLNQQAKMLEQQVENEVSLQDDQEETVQAVEKKTIDQAEEKPKKKGENWYFLKVKRIQLYSQPINYVVRKENGYHYFYIYMKLLAEALEGKSLVIVELYGNQELYEGIAEMISENEEACKNALEVLKEARLINIGEVDEDSVQCIEMLEFDDFVGPEKSTVRVRRHREKLKKMK